MIVISHTHAEGTLIEGSSKGDGVYEIVRRYGFSYFPSIGALGIRGSRDHVARRYVINAAANALRADGHEVEVRIDDTPRDRAQVLADQDERLDDRRERISERASKHAATAEAAHKADNLHTSVAENAIAAHLRERADVVGSQASRSARPDVTARRIKRLESDLRDIDRKLNGQTRRFRNARGVVVQVQTHEPASGQWRESLLAHREQAENQLAYDRAALQRAIDAGEYTAYGPDTVHVGDLVFNGFGWRMVVKVNRTTVSVETPYSWVDKIKFVDMTKVRCPHGETEDGAGA